MLGWKKETRYDQRAPAPEVAEPSGLLRSPQQSHHAAILHDLHVALRVDEYAAEAESEAVRVMARAQAARLEAADRVKAARAALRRVAEGSI